MTSAFGFCSTYLWLHSVQLGHAALEHQAIEGVAGIASWGLPGAAGVCNSSSAGPESNGKGLGTATGVACSRGGKQHVSHRTCYAVEGVICCSLQT